jgi:hypothetical protein
VAFWIEASLVFRARTVKKNIYYHFPVNAEDFVRHAEQSVPPPSLRFSRMSFSKMSPTRFGLLPYPKCYGYISSITENFWVSCAEPLMTP